LLLSPQNFDGCVDVPAVDTMSKDDKSTISIAEDIQDIRVAVRQVHCCISYFYITLGNNTNIWQ